MYKEDVKKINEWFETHECYGTYHHTKEEDGEDLYSVNSFDMGDFIDECIEDVSDLIGIPCILGKDGMYFTSEDLEKAVFY